MSSRARELLERARAADKLDREACQRISEGVLEKLARGESALPGVDVSPVALPKLRLWRVLWNGRAIKSLWLLGAGVVSITSFTAARVHQSEAVSAVQQDVSALPAPVSSQAEPSSALPQALEEPAAPATTTRAKHRSQARATASSTRAGPSATKKEPPIEGSRARSSARALPFNGAQRSADDPSPAASAAKLNDSQAASGQLDAELGLLRRAYSQLHAGNPGEAQALLEEHRARFPHGALVEPREVAYMVVLCKLGRERAARVRADSFLALHPKSPFVERVRSICSDNTD